MINPRGVAWMKKDIMPRCGSNPMNRNINYLPKVSLFNEKSFGISQITRVTVPPYEGIETCLSARIRECQVDVKGSSQVSLVDSR